jgi:hypothetical protein
LHWKEKRWYVLLAEPAAVIADGAWTAATY